MLDDQLQVSEVALMLYYVSGKQSNESLAS